MINEIINVTMNEKSNMNHEISNIAINEISNVTIYETSNIVVGRASVAINDH